MNIKEFCQFVNTNVPSGCMIWINYKIYNDLIRGADAHLYLEVATRLELFKAGWYAHTKHGITIGVSKIIPEGKYLITNSYKTAKTLFPEFPQELIERK